MDSGWDACWILVERRVMGHGDWRSKDGGCRMEDGGWKNEQRADNVTTCKDLNEASGRASAYLGGEGKSQRLRLKIQLYLPQP